MGADLRRLVSRGGAREPTRRRLSRARPCVRGRAVLLGRPAADCDPARRARDRIRVGRRRPGPSTLGRRVSPPHLPGWSMGVAGVSRAESDRRGRAQGPGEPALRVDVRQRGRGRHYVRADLARVEPVCRRHGRRARGCRARARARRDEHPRPFSQSTPDHHDPRRPPAPDLADLRCAGAASR